MTDISSLANPDILTQNHDIQFAARSDVLVMTNGRGNGNGNTLRSLADNYGQQGTKTIGVQYPAGIKTPFTPEDSHTYNESSAIAEAQQYNAYAQNKGKSIHFFAYSQGTEATIRTLNRIAAENGGTLPNNVTATIIGGPSVPGGLGDNEYQKALAPILSQFGIDITGDGPKSNGNIRYVTNESDLWGAGGSSSPVDLADKAIGTAFGGTHEYGYNAPSTTVKNPDGSITTTIHGGPMVNSDGYRIRSGIGSALARNQGVHVTREMDEAILAVRGDKDGNYNIPEITDKLARLADQQQPGTGDLVRTALPAVLPQEIADAATSVQNELPRVIASITNPGSLPEPDLSSILGNSQMPAGDTAPTSTYVEPEAAAPVYTAPAPVQQYVAPVQEFVQQTPVQEFIQQAPVQQAIQQAEQALPQQLAPQVAQGKALLGQLGVRLP